MNITVVENQPVVIVVNKGQKGEDGSGVPVGGSVGQALVKSSSADFDTSWVSVLKTSSNLGDVANADIARMNLNAISKTEAITYSLIFG